MVEEVVSWPAKMKVLIWSMAVVRKVGSIALELEDFLAAEGFWNSFSYVSRARVTTERLREALRVGLASPLAWPLASPLVWEEEGEEESRVAKRLSSSSPMRRSSLRPFSHNLMGRMKLMFSSGFTEVAGGMRRTCFLGSFVRDDDRGAAFQSYLNVSTMALGAF